jgi:hypothetical protein
MLAGPADVCSETDGMIDTEKYTKEALLLLQ